MKGQVKQLGKDSFVYGLGGAATKGIGFFPSSRLYTYIYTGRLWYH